MTKTEMRAEIVGLLLSKLRDGSFNCDAKDSIPSELYDVFCQVELDIADRIEKIFFRSKQK